MKLYLISQDINQDYDTYDAAVVAAESEQEARETHPDGSGYWEYYNWVKPSKKALIKVEYLGETDQPKGVVLASYNAG